MRALPPVPHVDDATDLFDEGHLWIQEKIDGAPLRFRLRDSGVVEFGDAERVFDPDGVPLSYRFAVRHVREHLDREALRAAVDDVESVTFFGEATRNEGTGYDWDRIPAVLGFDVWLADEGRFLPPDAAANAFERLGLAPVNAVEKEVRAAYFDVDGYEVPDSAWYDGPAEGVVIRNKAGGRAQLLHPRFRDDGGEGGDGDASPDVDPAESAADLADRFVTADRLDAVADRLEADGRAVTAETLYERVLETVAREEHAALFGSDRSFDLATFRSEVARHARQFASAR